LAGGGRAAPRTKEREKRKEGELHTENKYLPQYNLPGEIMKVPHLPLHLTSALVRLNYRALTLN
jgi:hypothetical protein